jgi:hypothetical protein
VTINAAYWIHGNNVSVEFPDRLEPFPEVGKAGSRKGYGTAFWGRSNAFNWFHFSIPTPVILNEQRYPLQKIFVFYSAQRSSIRNVHVYDGSVRIWNRDNLNLQGDHSRAIDSSNSWQIDPPITLRYGLGISVGVQFNSFIDEPNPNIHFEIFFSTAGADFGTL